MEEKEISHESRDRCQERRKCSLIVCILKDTQDTQFIVNRWYPLFVEHKIPFPVLIWWHWVYIFFVRRKCWSAKGCHSALENKMKLSIQQKCKEFWYGKGSKDRSMREVHAHVASITFVCCLLPRKKVWKHLLPEISQLLESAEEKQKKHLNLCQKIWTLSASSFP